MTHKWNTTGYIILFMSVLGFFFAMPAETQELIIDRDTIPLYLGLEKALGGTFEEEKPATIKLPSGKTVTTVGEPSFKIVKVTNISGNNPFHQAQPVFNFGGVQVATVSDLVDCIQSGKCASKPTGGGGGGGGGSGACCIPDRKDMLIPVTNGGSLEVRLVTAGSAPTSIKQCEWVAAGILPGDIYELKNNPVLYFDSDPYGTESPGYAYVATNPTYFNVIKEPRNSVYVTKEGLNFFRINWGGNIIILEDKKTKQKFTIPFAVIANYINKAGKNVLKDYTLSISSVSCSP